MALDLAKIRATAARAKAVMSDRPKRNPRPARSRKATTSVRNYADGPGTLMRQRLKGWGITSCSGCDKTAAKMDEWGPDECYARRDELAKEILPRAKTWLRKDKFRAWLAARFPERAEDAVLTKAIIKLVDDAVAESRAAQRPTTVDVLMVIVQGVGQWHESQTGFASVLAGAGITSQIEYVPNGGVDQVENALRESSPKVCLIRAMPFPADRIEALASRWPAVKFVVVCHSLPSHLVVWDGMTTKFSEYIKLANAAPNVWLGTPDERNPWGSIAKTVWVPNSAGDMPEGHDSVITGPVELSLVGRRDTIKNFPNQIIAAGIANKTRRCRLNVMVKGKSTELVKLAVACGLETLSHNWMTHDRHRERIANLIDIGLQSGFCESFNYVALEHLMAGKPVVGSPAIRFLPPEMQADQNDIEGMAALILRLADQIDADPSGSKARWRETGRTVADSLNSALVERIKSLL